MARLGSVAVRYMDDWVVVVPTRWKLRMAIRAVNQVMARLWVRQHPDNTIIGRIAQRFNFSGDRFSVAGLVVARQTVERCVVRLSQRDEQGVATSRSEPTRSAGRGGYELGRESQCRMSDRNRPPCRLRAPQK